MEKIRNFYEKNIKSLGKKLDDYFSGILTNLQLQFIKNKFKWKVFQWDIFMVNYWVNIWSEYKWIRPSVIISKEIINTTNMCIVIPITSYKDKKVFINDMVIENNNENWLLKKSVIKTTHIYTISKIRLIKKIWNISNEELNALIEKIKFLV